MCPRSCRYVIFASNVPWKPFEILDLQKYNLNELEIIKFKLSQNGTHERRY